MPTYVYKFIDSGETIEVQQAFTDEALTEIAHPSTGAVMKVKKVFTPIGVTFKGGGFYKTDSRPSGSSASSGSAATTPAAPASGGDSSSGSSGSSGGGSSAGGSASGGAPSSSTPAS
ncbi:MAG: FmdB family transcriptional regulator [Acidobacteria bacterium]|nr:FmdB family transcriptional regulator [Acidobacteriota bacterium]